MKFLLAPALCLFFAAGALADTAFFEVSVQGSAGAERVIVQLNDPALIQQARDIVSGKQTESVSVMGTLVRSPAFYNPGWSYHLDPGSIRFFSVATEVCDASASYVEEHLEDAGGAFLPNRTWCPWSSKVTREIPPPPGAATAIDIVSAASYRESAIGPGTLISIFGRNLNDRTEVYGTALAKVTVEIRRPGATEGSPIPVLLAAPEQINAIIPRDTAPGLVTLRVVNHSGGVFEGKTRIEGPASALFFVADNGQSYAAATLLRVHADGSRSEEPLVKPDVQGVLHPVGFSWGPAGDELYLTLYATGLGASPQGKVTVTVDSIPADVLYAGPQGSLEGLDQINIHLPRSLSGRAHADVVATIEGANGYPVSSNAVRILMLTYF